MKLSILHNKIDKLIGKELGRNSLIYSSYPIRGGIFTKSKNSKPTISVEVPTLNLAKRKDNFNLLIKAHELGHFYDYLQFPFSAKENSRSYKRLGISAKKWRVSNYKREVRAWKNAEWILKTLGYKNITFLNNEKEKNLELYRNYYQL